MTRRASARRTAIACAAVTYMAVLAAVLGAGNAHAGPAPDSDVAALGASLADALNARDVAKLTKLVDARRFALRASIQLIPDERLREAFAAELARRRGTELLTQDFATLDRTGGTAKMIKLVRRGDETRPLIRMDLGDRGFTYLEYVVERMDDGELRAIDWYQLTTGELASDSIGGLARLLATNDSRGSESVDSAVLETLRNASALEQAGKPGAALDVLQALPEHIADTPRVLKKRIVLANLSRAKELYFALLDQLAREHANDPSAALLLLDHYFAQSNLEGALRAIATVESRVGQDGMTHLLRANAHAMAGAYAETVRHAEEAIRLEPKLEPAYFALADAHARRGEFARAVATYRRIEAELGYAFTAADFAARPENAELMRSDAFRTWMPPAGPSLRPAQ